MPGTVLEYAGTLGASGIRPTQRVGIFDAGYIFGRTGWGETRPFTQESTYSIRFGPARKLHGHEDHTSVTYTSHGRDILIDGGHSGYKWDDWRSWAKSQFSHNEMTVLSTAAEHPETKLNRSSIYVDVGVLRVAGLAGLRHRPDSRGAGVEGSGSDGGAGPRDVGFGRGLPDVVASAGRSASAVKGNDSVVAQRPGDRVKTTLLQIPFQQETTPIQVATGQTDPIQGWHYVTIDKRRPAPVVKFTRSGRRASILSVIVPTRSNAAVSYTTTQQGSRLLVTLKVDGVSTTIAVAPDGTLKRVQVRLRTTARRLDRRRVVVPIGGLMHQVVVRTGGLNGAVVVPIRRFGE